MINMQVIEYTFLVFMFLSYEFFCKIRSANLSEVVESSVLGRVKTECSKFVVMIFLNIILTTIFFVYHINMNAAYRNASKEYTHYIVCILLIYHFGTYLLGVLIGWAASFVKYRLVGYACLLSVSYIFGYHFVSILQSASYTENFYYNISGIFCLYAQDYSACNNFYYYLLPIEDVNLQRLGFWAFFLISFIILFTNRGSKRLRVLIPFAVTILCAIFFFRPTSVPRADLGMSGHDFWTGDQTYYEITNPVDESIYEDANFKITHYKLDFKIRRQLKASVEVTVDRSELSEYKFTLYHGYQVSSIKNQSGKPMEFSQFEDYILVKNRGNDLIEKLYLEYEGYGKTYYSTSQGAYLPAYFEYYPIPGYQKVYFSKLGYGGFSLECLPYEVEFNVKIDTGKKVYCNLDTIGYNKFHGMSNGLTLLSGLFIKESTVNNTRIIYPELDVAENSPDLNREKFEKFIDLYKDSKYSLKNKTIFIPPYGNYPSYCFSSDHAIGELFILEDNLKRYISEGQLYDFMEEEEFNAEVEKLENQLREQEQEDNK